MFSGRLGKELTLENKTAISFYYYSSPTSNTLFGNKLLKQGRGNTVLENSLLLHKSGLFSLSSLACPDMFFFVFCANYGNRKKTGV